MSHIQCQTIIPAGKFEVFQHLSNPALVADQLKDSIEVKWQNPGIEVQPQAEFLFSMSRFGVDQPVRFRIDKYVHGHQLSYHQIEGLFRNWVHTIKCEEHGSGETLVTDFVDYELPFGLLGKIVDDVWVRNDLRRILFNRLERVKAFFTKQGHASSEPLAEL